MKQTVVTRNEGETKKFGREFFKRFHLDQGGTLALYGELGSGKTTFVQGLAEGLEIKRRVISPTFIIVRSYKLRTKNPELSNLYHIDLYRIDLEKEVEGLGLQEIINDNSAIVAIEWAEKLGEQLPKKRWDLHFRYVDESTREIKIEKHD